MNNHRGFASIIAMVLLAINAIISLHYFTLGYNRLKEKKLLLREVSLHNKFNESLAQQLQSENSLHSNSKSISIFSLDSYPISALISNSRFNFRWAEFSNTLCQKESHLEVTKSCLIHEAYRSIDYLKLGASSNIGSSGDLHIEELDLTSLNLKDMVSITSLGDITIEAIRFFKFPPQISIISLDGSIYINDINIFSLCQSTLEHFPLFRAKKVFYREQEVDTHMISNCLNHSSHTTYKGPILLGLSKN